MLKNNKTVLLVLFFLNIFSWLVFFDLEKNKNFEVCFFYVGQGDSILIKTKEGHKILIDGGPDDSILKNYSKLGSTFNKEIDLMVLTHPHKDHLFGLVEVLKKYNVKNILLTNIDFKSSLYEEFKNLIKKENARIFIARKGFVAKFANHGFLKVIYPFESLEKQKIRDKHINDTSIVLMLNYFDDKMLFTGDISQKVEAKLILSGQSLEADVLKIAHHGSKDSSSLEFLKEVAPSVAVISVGRNNIYNLPSQEVLNNLEKQKIKVERTDKNGNICLIQKKKKQFYLLSQTE